MIRSLMFVALALVFAPAQAADYTQAPGSTLTFATRYQGEVFSGRFPNALRVYFNCSSALLSLL